MVSIFVELSLMIVVTLLVCSLLRFLKQPLVIGYVLTGIIMGPAVLNAVHATEALATFSNIGVALLLFMVGLNLNPRAITEVGKVSILGGGGQVLFTGIIGYWIAQLLGYAVVPSIYIGIALTFSSTIIIMKLLSDKGDLDTLYGRISVGILIVQDFIAIAVLIIMSAIFGSSVSTQVFEMFLKGFGLIIFAFLAGTYLLPKITQSAAKSQEYLLLFSLAWCLALATLFELAGFSIEIGALLAGITIALSPYRFEISAKIKPLRDFFIVLFFVFLGSQMIFINMAESMIPILIFSVFMLVGTPIIVLAIMGAMNYTKKTSFMVGLALAQLSEFSFILMGVAYKYGHINQEVLSMVTSVGVITIAGSAYLISYAPQIYHPLAPFLSIFERHGKKVDEHKHKKSAIHDIILFGYNRIGYGLLESFKKIQKRFLVVDFNPETIKDLAAQGNECLYGDASDPELLDELDFKRIKMAISSIPDFETNIVLLSRIRQQNKKAIIMVISHQIDEGLKLYEAGATYVIMPHFLGGTHTSAMIERYELDVSKFIKERIAHIEHLKERKKLGHDLPLHEKA